MHFKCCEREQIYLYVFYQAQITEFIKRKTIFKQNFCKAYSVICEYYRKKLYLSIGTHTKLEL